MMNLMIEGCVDESMATEQLCYDSASDSVCLQGPSPTSRVGAHSSHIVVLQMAIMLPFDFIVVQIFVNVELINIVI